MVETRARVQVVSGGRTRQMAAAALVAALLAAAAWVTIPTGAVPITLQVFAVVLAALVLEPRWALAAVGTYLLMGAAGVPVFAGAKGGLGVLFGPTGGYLWGFLAGAFVASSLRSLLADRFRPIVADAAAVGVCLALVHALGLLHFTFVTGTAFVQAATLYFAPYIVLDLAKSSVALGVAGALRRSGVLSWSERH